MANTYKNIVITPGINSSVDDPKIVFSGANTTANTDITLRAYPTSNGTLSFEGTAGQLFSITNDLSGVLFSVNDVSGIPSIEAYANGDIRLAEFSGNVSIGTSNSSAKLFVNGNTVVNGTLSTGNTTITGFANVTSTIQGGAGLIVAGAASGITTLAAGNTTITGFANVTSTIQGGAGLTIAGAASGITTLAAGNTTITGFANATVSVNSALLTVGSSFIANTLGAYHTGTVNAASHTVGTAFIANSIGITTTGYGNVATTLAAGNTTITGFVNATSTIQGGAGLTLAGAASGITTLAAGNTTLTGSLTLSDRINQTGTVTASAGYIQLGGQLNSTQTGQQNMFTMQSQVYPQGAGTLSALYGLLFLPTIISSANNITNINPVFARVDSLASYTGTVDTINTIQAGTPSWGSATGITTVNQFLAQNATATNVFGFKSAISAAAGKWNIYAQGTANNYMAGGLGIGTNSLTQPLTVTGNAAISANLFVTNSVNAASHTVGTDFIANTLGAYHTGVVNAASHTVGTNFIANSIGITSTGYANIATTLAAGNTTITGSITVTGNLIVNGTTTTISGNNLSITDNMIYFNNGVAATITNIVANGTYIVFTANNNYSAGWDVDVFGVSPTIYNGSYNNIFAANATTFTVASANTGAFVSGGTARGKTDSNPDLGFAAAYNDGTYHHAGFYRDSTDGYWKVFDNYDPEPDASVFIDKSNNSFHIANFWSNTARFGNTTVYSTVNTTSFTGTSNNSTYFGGYTWAAPGALGTTTVNTAAFSTLTVSTATYGEVYTSQFASVWGTAAGANPYSIMQVRSNDGTSGMGMQAYAGLYSKIYTSNGFVFTTGATLRDKDFPTGGTTRATLDSTGLTVTGIANVSSTLAAGNTTITGFANVTGSLTSGDLTTGAAYITTSIDIDGSGGLNGIITFKDKGNSYANSYLLYNDPSDKFTIFSNRSPYYQWQFDEITGNLITPKLSSGNTTITGFANVTSTIQGGAGLTIAGAASGITTLAAGNTTVTGFANISSTLAAGNTTVTGFANIISDSASIQVGNTTSYFSGNTSGFYPVSNTAGNALGNATARWVITGAAGTFTGLTTSGTLSHTGPTGNYGSSTAAATYQLGYGATTTGLLKTINMGTSGATGSTTNVNIGSTLSNTFVTINANTVTYTGALSGITTLAAGNTTTTGFANVSTTLQVGANVTIAATAALIANSSPGTSGQVLSTNASAIYWTTPSIGAYYKGNQGTIGLAADAANIFRINSNTVSSNITFLAGENASAAGPITIGSGFTVTVSTGARMVIV